MTEEDADVRPGPKSDTDARRKQWHKVTDLLQFVAHYHANGGFIIDEKQSQTLSTCGTRVVIP